MGEMAEYYGIEAEIHEMCVPKPRPVPTATIWVTREGQRIAVRKMTDSHLVNTIRYLRRVGEVQKNHQEAAMYSGLGFLNGEGALDCLESEITAIEEMPLDEYIENRCPTFAAMLAEAEKRGLTEATTNAPA